MTRPSSKSAHPPEERLLRLTALLLSRREPTTFEQIREEFPDDYDGSPAAVDKKWTRDKQALANAGIPIEFVDGLEEQDSGYVIDPRAYYLPELKLTPEELAVLWAAGNAAVTMGTHPWHADLESALRKLGCVQGEPAARPTVPAVHFGESPEEMPRQYIEDLGEAVRRRKRVTLRYFTAKRQEETEREVDVYGFAWRRGVWLFAGWCHLRKAQRVFYLSRVRALALNPRNPSKPDYEIPKDFDIHTFAVQQPWNFLVHEPAEARVRFTGDLAGLAGQLLPGASVEEQDGVAVASVRSSNLGALVRQVLSFGPDAEILAPPEAREQATTILQRWGPPASPPAPKSPSSTPDSPEEKAPRPATGGER